MRARRRGGDGASTARQGRPCIPFERRRDRQGESRVMVARLARALQDRRRVWSRRWRSAEAQSAAPTDHASQQQQERA